MCFLLLITKIRKSTEQTSFMHSIHTAPKRWVKQLRKDGDVFGSIQSSKGANTPYLAKTIAPHWRRGTRVPIVMTSDYQCPSNYVVRDIQRRGSQQSGERGRGERGGWGWGKPRDSSEGPPTLHFPPTEEDATRTSQLYIGMSRRKPSRPSTNGEGS